MGTAMFAHKSKNGVGEVKRKYDITLETNYAAERQLLAFLLNRMKTGPWGK